MIVFRHSNFEVSKDDLELKIVDGELLSAAITRVTADIDLGKFTCEDVFSVAVNGVLVEPWAWSQTALKESDNVMIVPTLKGGQTFKQVALLAIAIVASVVVSPAVGGGIWGALAATAITVGSSLLLNALIPPPNAGGLDTGDLGVEGSQMYSISGQSNQVKRFGSVPKVYGNHRVYPFVAANPYVQLEIDPDTKEVVQYLYCVYDFGFGPMKVDALKIGDTYLSNFSDVEYNLVDPNKPAISEGEWDDQTIDAFKIYKADADVANLAVVLDGNQVSGGPVDTWQATRTTGLNTDGVDQEVIMSFVNPQGLIGVAADGTKSTREIALIIEFSKVGMNDWHGFNDLNFVSNFSAIGGQGEDYMPNLILYPMRLSGSPINYSYNNLGTVRNGTNYNPTTKRTYSTNYPSSTPMFMTQMGLAAGRKQICIKKDSRVITGATVKIKGIVIGRVQSISGDIVEGSNVYNIITVDQGPPQAIVLFTYMLPSGASPTSHGGADLVLVDSVQTGKGVAIPLSIGKAYISRQDTSPVYSEFRFTPREVGQFDIRITRQNTTSPYTAQVQDTLTWTTLTTRFDRQPIVTDKRHVLMEMRIRATNQLNGSIQNLNAVCTSALDVYDPDTSTWSKELTNNPAWVFADLMTSEINKKALSKSRLDTASLLEWRDFCDQVPTPPPDAIFEEPRFQCNFVLDYETTLQDVLNQVASSAQASINIIDGRYGVLIDKLRTIPIQVFTPRNSKDFQSTRNYGPKPQGIRIKYIDPSTDWQVAEVEVFDNGFDTENATDYDELTTFGCTNHEQAWRFGRYMMAQNRLRQETIQITVDFEYLICTRGDYVQITQDVMKVGGTPARVKSIDGNEVTIDDGIDTDPDEDYGYVIRKANGEIATDTLSIISSDTFALDGDLPSVGDLIVIGVVGSEVFDCIVKAIKPNDDLTAQLILVEKADAIYEAESTDVLPEYDPQIAPATDVNKPPGEVDNLEVTDNAYYCLASAFQNYVDLSWDAPLGSAVEIYEVYADDGKGYNRVATTRDSVYRYLVATDRLDIEHSFKILAVSSRGLKKELGTVSAVSATPLEKTSAPSDIENLHSDITGEVLQLFWPKIPDCGCREYLIRYSTMVEGASWEQSIPLLRVDKNVNTASTQARTGTYLIKAVDFNNNESDEAALTITTIPQLFNLNIIESITDAPDFEGVRDRVTVSGEAIFLTKDIQGGVDHGYLSEGFYYYESLLDLGEVYTVRLQSQIQAEGYAGDFMIDWLTLSAVAALSIAGSSDWDVETQYRSTEEYNVIADWANLSDIVALDSGSEEQWTPWRKFAMGDATGRIFQFRLRLISNVAYVSPRVFDALIKADMPDRQESYQNLSADDTTGYILTYAPAFKGPGSTPSVGISLEDGESGDYWEFVSKTLDGFQIKFYDKNDTQVARQFDVQVKGYGRKSTSVI